MDQVSSRPGWGCKFSPYTGVCAWPKHSRTFSRPLIFYVAINKGATFDWVDREITWRGLPLNDIPQKFISFFQPFVQSRNVEFLFIMIFNSSWTQEAFFNSVLFHLLILIVIQVIVYIAVSSCENTNTDIWSNSKLSELNMWTAMCFWMTA